MNTDKYFPDFQPYRIEDKSDYWKYSHWKISHFISFTYPVTLFPELLSLPWFESRPMWDCRESYRLQRMLSIQSSLWGHHFNSLRHAFMFLTYIATLQNCKLSIWDTSDGEKKFGRFLWRGRKSTLNCVFMQCIRGKSGLLPIDACGCMAMELRLIVRGLYLWS